MKLTKNQLRKLILEEKERLLEMHGDHMPQQEHESSAMPCPMSTASQMKDAGATPADLMSWIGQLLNQFNEPQQSEPQVLVDDGDEFSFTGDVGELPGDEAGSHGL